MLRPPFCILLIEARLHPTNPKERVHLLNDYWNGGHFLAFKDIGHSEVVL